MDAEQQRKEQQRKEQQRWLFAIGLVSALCLLVFFFIVLRNADIILVGTFLLIFQISIAAVIVILAVAIALVSVGLILKYIWASEEDISKQLEATRKTLARATSKLGSDLCTTLAGFMLYLIQEPLTDYSAFYRIIVSAVFTANFFVAAQLIGSDEMAQKIMGIFFFIVPIITFAIPFFLLLPPGQIQDWISSRSVYEVVLMVAAALSILLSFGFAFLKSREIQVDRDATRV